MAKACASHGSRNTGPPESTGIPGKLAAAASGRLEVGFPGIDRDLEFRVALRAPQLAAVEAHGIEPLRIFAGARRVAVGKDVAAVHALDGAHVAADVARQAGVRARVQVLGADPIASLEPRGRRRHARNRGPPRKHPIDILRRENALDRTGLAARMAGGDLIGTHQAALRRKLLEAGEPELIVAL